MSRLIALLFFGLNVMMTQSACFPFGDGGVNPRTVMFIGVDISGSFTASPFYDDSLRFLAHYIYFHLKGLGGLDVPHSLFVGSMGGSVAGEVKSFFPIQNFQDRSISEIESELNKIFPKGLSNPFTDFNAYFEKVAETVKMKKLILKPLSIVLLTDGKPDFPEGDPAQAIHEGEEAQHPVYKPLKDEDFRKINLAPLELISRNVTIRVLYTDPQTSKAWLTKVPRKRIKIWTQEPALMAGWRDPKIFSNLRSWEEQPKLFEWIQETVDYNVRAKRVD